MREKLPNCLKWNNLGYGVYEIGDEDEEKNKKGKPFTSQ